MKEVSFTITYYLTFAVAGLFWWLLIYCIRGLIKDFGKIKKFSITDKIAGGFFIVLLIIPLACALLTTYAAETGWLAISTCESPLLREYKVMIKRETICVVNVVARSERHAEDRALLKLKYINQTWTAEDTTAFVKYYRRNEINENKESK